MQHKQRNLGGRTLWSLALPGALAASLAAFGLGGCENVPDTVNPFTKSEDSKMTVIKTTEIPGGNRPYPNLASVPPRPTYAMTPAERAKTVTRLKGDQTQGSGAIRANRGVGARPAPDARELALVGFGPDSADLPFSAEPILEQIAAAQKTGGGRVYVVGHAAQGTRRGDGLALERAGVIAARLETLGVDAAKIEVTSAGTREPRARGVGGIGDDRAEIFLGS